MSRRLILRDEEVRVISVTPVGRGIVRPFLLAVVFSALVQYASYHLHFVREERPWFLLVLVGPCLLVVATRTWRWRSHKVHVTSQRILVEGGVANHFQSSYELRDIVNLRVEQRVGERLARRGSVLIDTVAGPIVISRVRHPAALCRLIDRERAHYPREQVPLDTIFEFPESAPTQYRVTHRERRDRR